MISYLVDTNYIVKLGNDDYVVSNLLIREGTPTKPTKVTPPDFKAFATLKDFIKDSKIPHRIKTHSGSFFMPGTESDYARKFLFNELCVTERYRYEDMVKATELYYNNERMARVSLTNYFKNGVFEQVMEDYLKGNKDTGAMKSNKTSL